MLSYSLGDGAELRSLEPWNAAEFIASVERDRAHLAPWLPWSGIKDEESARAMLQNYADQQAQEITGADAARGGGARLHRDGGARRHGVPSRPLPRPFP